MNDICTVCGKSIEVVAQRGTGFCSQLCARSGEPGYDALVARFAEQKGDE